MVAFGEDVAQELLLCVNRLVNLLLLGDVDHVVAKGISGALDELADGSGFQDDCILSVQENLSFEPVDGKKCVKVVDSKKLLALKMVRGIGLLEIGNVVVFKDVGAEERILLENQGIFVSLKMVFSSCGRMVRMSPQSDALAGC